MTGLVRGEAHVARYASLVRIESWR